MTTNFDELIPKDIILFSIKDISDLGLIKSDYCKKLIYSHQIEVVKLGAKNFISRTALLTYLNSRVIEADNPKLIA